MTPEINRDLAETRERVAVVENELKALRQLAEGVKLAAENTIRNTERLENLRDDLNDMAGVVRAEVSKAVESCKELGVDLDKVTKRIEDFSDARTTSRATIIVGLLGFAGIIATAVLPKLIG